MCTVTDFFAPKGLVLSFHVVLYYDGLLNIQSGGIQGKGEEMEVQRYLIQISKYTGIYQDKGSSSEPTTNITKISERLEPNYNAMGAEGLIFLVKKSF